MLFAALGASSPVQILLVCLYLAFAWLLCMAVNYAIEGEQ